MFLAIGSTDIPYDKAGRIDFELASRIFKDFSNSYGPKCSEIIKPLVLGRYDAPGYPTFLQLGTLPPYQAFKITLSPQDYTANSNFTSGPIQTQHPGTALPPGFLVQTGPSLSISIPVSSETRTPGLDNFRLSASDKYRLDVDRDAGRNEVGLNDYREEVEDVKRERTGNRRRREGQKRILDPYNKQWAGDEYQARGVKDRLQGRI